MFLQLKADLPSEPIAQPGRPPLNMTSPIFETCAETGTAKPVLLRPIITDGTLLRPIHTSLNAQRGA